jgi:predicted NodU family carbamoyl transferase
MIGLTYQKMAGVLGFEPRDDGIKIRCLTAWLYPKNKAFIKEVFLKSKKKMALPQIFFCKKIL